MLRLGSAVLLAMGSISCPAATTVNIEDVEHKWGSLFFCDLQVFEDSDLSRFRIYKSDTSSLQSALANVERFARQNFPQDFEALKRNAFAHGATSVWGPQRQRFDKVSAEEKVKALEYCRSLARDFADKR